MIFTQNSAVLALAARYEQIPTADSQPLSAFVSKEPNSREYHAPGILQLRNDQTFGIVDRRSRLTSIKLEEPHLGNVLMSTKAQTGPFGEIIGESLSLRATMARLHKVARTDTTVLITGETGTGKELLARAIHKNSPRISRPFVSVNCAAVPKDLIASELFGHEKGAFTGAVQRRAGRFEQAQGGTLFLDEIGELSPDIQVSLLRVIQEREFQRVGSNISQKADVRIVTATHRDLNAAVASGTFRADLLYRINVFPIENAPLRHRKDDIPLLVEHFIHHHAAKTGKTIRSISRESMHRLQAYSWPGNIRELQNVIERSVILCETDELIIDETWAKTGEQPRALVNQLLSQEVDLIESALAETRGRVAGPKGAAAKLGMAASTLDSRIRALKINKFRFHAA